MRVKIKVGQVWCYKYSAARYRIVYAATRYDEYNIANYIGHSGQEEQTQSVFGRVGDDGLTDLHSWNLALTPKDIIKVPLDPSLPILQAGYLQDRMIRRGK
jgi:hypothetical protein